VLGLQIVHCGDQLAGAPGAGGEDLAEIREVGVLASATVKYSGPGFRADGHLVFHLARGLGPVLARQHHVQQHLFAGPRFPPRNRDAVDGQLLLLAKASIWIATCFSASDLKPLCIT